MTELTKQQKIEMKEVVDAMPEVFLSREKELSVYVYHAPYEKGGIALCEPYTDNRVLSPAQHTAWVEKCLMAWLEDEGRGYRFMRNYKKQWCAYDGKGVMVTELHEWIPLWSCLYVAFKHWQESQKPKEEKREPQTVLLTEKEYNHLEKGGTIALAKGHMQGGKNGHWNFIPKEKTLREKLQGALREVYPGSSKELNADEAIADVCLPVFIEHIKGKQGAVEEILEVQLQDPRGEATWTRSERKKMVGAIMAAVGEQR